jgi:hypothetical protein
MEPKFKTSFIPKKPISAQSSSSRKGVGFLTLISSVIFVGTSLFAAGVFMYKLTVEQRIEAQIKTLEKVRQSFEPNFISQATRLNRRIVAANKILDSHLSPSSIFELLETFTLKTISFSSFQFEDSVDGKVIVSARGEGDSFASVVLQSDEFGNSGYMRDVLFSGLEPNQQGNVDFTFEATLDPQLILYRKSLVPVSYSEDLDEFNDLEGIEQLDEDYNPEIFSDVVSFNEKSTNIKYENDNS